ncbi:MAG TPA: hypothetical protein VK980_11470 [Sphingomonas sp.]|nr:hypothetical protein [Sphingomonas sp.]
MRARFTGSLLALWLVLALLILVIAFNAVHFSVWEFVIPAADPLTWISPSLLFGPPLLIAMAHRASPRVSRLVGWALAIILGMIVVAILVLFSSAFLGS